MSDEIGKSSDAAIESESFNLLLNKPEAHALKSGHCMKEDCSICKVLVNVGESQSSVVVPVPAKDCRELKNDSNISLGICRICHCNPETLPELGLLQSVCNCRGTVALVHMTCLERWLAESDSSSCELCRFQFTVERIPKHGPFESVLVWINEVADFNQVRRVTFEVSTNGMSSPFCSAWSKSKVCRFFNVFAKFSQADQAASLLVQKDFIYFTTTLPLMSILAAVAINNLMQLVMHCFCNSNSSSLHCSGISHFILCLAKLIHYNLKFKLLMDTIWFWLMTPLAAMAGYIFVRATSELIDDNFPTDAPWLMAALMLNSCLTLVAYYGWVMNSVKKHVSSWYRWWRTVDCIIKIQIPERQLSSTIPEADEVESSKEILPEVQNSEKNFDIKLAGQSSAPHDTLVSNLSPSLVKLVKRESSKREIPKRKVSSVGRVKGKSKTSQKAQQS